MANGYTGKILRVNLTDGQIAVETPPESFYRRYLGGHGFVGYYLLNEVPRGADPVGPDNLLIFAGGATTGVPVAGAGRSSVGGKSPLTGLYGEAEAGGFFGAEMRMAGFDAIVIRGRAQEPVYLWVHDGEAEIRPARHLWGLTTLECRRALQQELGDPRVRVAVIGPSGEMLSPLACIMHDVKHAAGRTGMGAVMGSKNLKAIATRGQGAIPIASPDDLKTLARWMRDNWRSKAERLHDSGTAGGVMELNDFGALPTRNFQDGRFAGAEKISGQTMRDTILIDRGGCYACPIRCKRVVSVDDAEYRVDPEYGGPEYETIGAVGSNCGVDDLRAISKANELCNAYGLDTISTGMMVSFAMECYEAGLLTLADTDGIDLRFGNAAAMVQMIERIGKRQGLGDLLAQGPRVAAARIGRGAEQYALHVKGQPLPMHECRNRHGQALGYAVSPTGADHMHNFWDESMRREPVDRELQGFGVYTSLPPNELNVDKVRAYAHVSNWTWLDNQFGMCMFVPWTVDQLVQLVNAITGWQTNVFELQLAAQRALTVARAFNLREGLTRADDALPARMATPFKSGSINERPVDPAVLDRHLSVFYGIMGWDPQTGVPTPATLQKLDLEWVAPHLGL
ncbi:MAG: aldehyde ferredoxin oxidoreductase family protein [Anaerolineae bacterium]|nr:aldehyde ferredoxin oxidoreductase family protein [Anaerolineae bacterium]